MHFYHHKHIFAHSVKCWSGYWNSDIFITLLKYGRMCLGLSIWFNLLQIRMPTGYSKSEYYQNLHLCRGTRTEDALIACRYLAAHWAHLTVCFYQTWDHSSSFFFSFSFVRLSVWLTVFLPLKAKTALTPKNLQPSPSPREEEKKKKRVVLSFNTSLFLSTSLLCTVCNFRG